MKKTVASTLAVIALMATSSAMAEVTNASLTTKGYVDAGLNYVHGEIQDVKSDVSDNASAITVLQNTINGDGTNAGLTSTVADLQDDVGDLSDEVSGLGTAVGTAGTGGATGTGLTGRIETLENQMQNVPSALTGENGVTISNGKAQITGLSTTSASDNKMYILKNNQATELSVADTWTNPWVVTP